MVPSAVMERTVMYLALPCWLGYEVGQYKTYAQSRLGRELQKRGEEKKHHNSNVLNATGAQHLSRLPLPTHPPGNSCAVYLKEGEKRS